MEGFVFKKSVADFIKESQLYKVFRVLQSVSHLTKFCGFNWGFQNLRSVLDFRSVLIFRSDSDFMEYGGHFSSSSSSFRTLLRVADFTECFKLYGVFQTLQSVTTLRSVSNFTECFKIYRVLRLYRVFQTLRSVSNFTECYSLYGVFHTLPSVSNFTELCRLYRVLQILQSVADFTKCCKLYGVLQTFQSVAKCTECFDILAFQECLTLTMRRVVDFALI